MSRSWADAEASDWNVWNRIMLVSAGVTNEFTVALLAATFESGLAVLKLQAGSVPIELSNFVAAWRPSVAYDNVPVKPDLVSYVIEPVPPVPGSRSTCTPAG